MDSIAKGAVLIAEDQPALLKALSMLLRKLEHPIITVEDGAQAWDIIQSGEQEVDLIVSDWMMPKMTGHDLLVNLRSLEEYQSLPFLMLTAMGTEDALMNALNSGANDFVSKPYKGPELLVRCKNLLRLRMEFKALRERSVRDSLTGLYNHKYFKESLTKEVSRYKRYGGDLGLILFDIDHFKLLNDTYGHQGGDLVLKHIAEMLPSLFRESDVICRYGGEEFAVILPSTSLEDTKAKAEQVRCVFAETIIDYNESGIKFTSSFGVTQCGQDDETAAIIKRADESLYKAKELGRNQVHASGEQSV